MAEQNSNLDALRTLSYLQQLAKLGGTTSSLFSAPGAASLFGGAGGALGLPGSVTGLAAGIESGDPVQSIQSGLSTLQNLNNLSKLYSYFSPALSGGALAAEAAALAPVAAAELAAGTTSAGLAGIAGLPMGAGATGAAAGAGAGAGAAGAASTLGTLGTGLGIAGLALAPALFGLSAAGAQDAFDARQWQIAAQMYPRQVQEALTAMQTSPSRQSLESGLRTMATDIMGAGQIVPHLPQEVQEGFSGLERALGTGVVNLYNQLYKADPQSVSGIFHAQPGQVGSYWRQLGNLASAGGPQLLQGPVSEDISELIRGGPLDKSVYTAMLPAEVAAGPYNEAASFYMPGGWSAWEQLSSGRSFGG